tara:strand:- start:22989 stop:24656 length:1668 start_codon:yes stop_codon:yes gene_type:complete
MNKQEAITLFIDKGYLISPDFFELNTVDIPQFIETFNKKITTKEKPLIIHKDCANLINAEKQADINWLEFEKSRVMYEKGKNKNIYQTFLDLLHYNTDTESKERIDTVVEEVQQPEEEQTIEQDELVDSNVILVDHYKEESKKRTVKDFISHYKARYNFLKGLLQQRPELQSVVSINRSRNKPEMEQMSIIGIVYDKRVTAKGNLLFTLEDVTGTMKILVNQNKPDLYAQAEKICVDEVIGVTGPAKNNMLFVNTLSFPDIPKPTQTPKKCEQEVLAAFISDVHFGSKDFLGKNFQKFVDWLNGKSEDEKEKKQSQKIKYIFILGDLVDGVGVYPGQEENLLLHDIREQYHQAYEYISQIRPDINIIMAPGNHDAVRVTEPQPNLTEAYAKELCSLPNFLPVSSPCFVNIHSSKNFEGFNVLMYHGSSFHYYIDNVPFLRQQKARDNPGEILKLLLQKRHLAPSHSSTTFVPYENDDPLLIKKVPDIIVAGDMHKSDISNYNGVLIINTSCWQRKTDYQEKTGNNPDPCKVPLFNLKTREITTKDFSDKEEETKQ